MYEREKVFHRVYGDGYVISCNKTEIIVDFSSGRKKMSLKSMIEKGIFSFENSTIQAEFDPITSIKEKKQNNPEEYARLTDERNDDTPIVQNNKEAKEKLLYILKEYKFEGFLHTTELDNFHKIIKSGYLIPRDDLEKRGVIFHDSANSDVLARTDDIVKQCCRFYYYFMTPTNYCAGYKHPVTIVYYEDLIFNDKSFFTQYNAANMINGWTNDPKEALEFNWEGIFERGGYSHSKYYRERDGRDNKDYIKALRNAEFLIHGRVDIAYIKKVYFKNKQDFEEAKLFCPKGILRALVCDERKFY